MRILLLGTGTPAPSARRAGSSFLVEFDDRRLLFDCGPGAHLRLLQAGRSSVGLSHLFLTHLHYDHCADYAVLELVRWDQAAGRVPELAVVGPAGTARMTARLFGSGGVYAADIRARTRHAASREVYEGRGGTGTRRPPAPVVTELADGACYDGDGWRVRAAGMVHCEPYVLTLAYRLETRAGHVVFGADTAPTPRLVALARGADVLLHMCHFLEQPGVDPRVRQSCSSHLDAARTARDAGVTQLVLVHIGPELERGETRARVLREATAVFRGPIVFGEDLLEIDVTAKRRPVPVAAP